jgi:hypothetical protein
MSLSPTPPRPPLPRFECDACGATMKLVMFQPDELHRKDLYLFQCRCGAVHEHTIKRN